jgi:hypothetical protein
MSEAYYSLVTGLPDLLLDEGREKLSFPDMAADLDEWISPDDARLTRYVRFPFDNANLILLLGEAKDGRQFDARGFFNQEELLEAVKTGGDGDIPDYLHSFLSAKQDGKDLFPGLSSEDQLAWLFYEETTDNKNRFISEFFTFDRDLRNILAGMNARFITLKGGESELRTLLERSIIGRNDVAQAILKSSAPDFGLGQSAPGADRVFSLDEHKPVDREKAIDRLRWETASDLSWFSGFGIGAILGFLVRLAIASRWQNLEPETGKKMFDALADEIKKGFKI